MSYWGFDGRAHRLAGRPRERGPATCRGSSAGSSCAEFPIRRMRSVDAYGGNDDRSMAADNTSAFNCRFVSGTSRWSRHPREGDRRQPGREPVRLRGRAAPGRARLPRPLDWLPGNGRARAGSSFAPSRPSAGTGAAAGQPPGLPALLDDRELAPDPLYLMCVTFGESITSASSTLASAGPTPSKSRVPPPRITGATWSRISSTRPAFRYCCATSPRRRSARPSPRRPPAPARAPTRFRR